MPSFDESWDKIYGAGKQLNRYPWSDVISFVFRHRPERLAAEISVLEVGCGAGPNVGFFAAEGFRAFGIDASAAVVAAARERLAAAGLSAEIQEGDFTILPYADDSMDLVIDRAALTHADQPAIEKAVAEIRRVLKPGGKFLFTPFADSHGGFAATVLARKEDPTDLAGFQVTYFNGREIARLFEEGWQLIICTRREEVDMLAPANTNASWIVVAKKK